MVEGQVRKAVIQKGQQIELVDLAELSSQIGEVLAVAGRSPRIGIDHCDSLLPKQLKLQVKSLTVRGVRTAVNIEHGGKGPLAFGEQGIALQIVVDKLNQQFLGGRIGKIRVGVVEHFPAPVKPSRISVGLG